MKQRGLRDLKQLLVGNVNKLNTLSTGKVFITAKQTVVQSQSVSSWQIVYSFVKYTAVKMINNDPIIFYFLV